MTPRNLKLLGIQAGRGAGTSGAQDGPSVLRREGLVQRLAAGGHDVEDLGNVPGVSSTHYATGGINLVRNLPNILQVNRHTHAAILGLMRRCPDAFPLIVGGDHSLAIGTLAGLADQCERLGLIWVDAHADFNTPESSPSGNVHGMSLAVACGHGLRDLRLLAGRDPMVRESDVHLLGVRDIDSGEMQNLDASQVQRLDAAQLRAAGVADVIRTAAAKLSADCDHVHLSFDIDSLDADLVPGTGTPVPGGLTHEEALDLLAALSATDALDSAEFVEYNPGLDPDGITGQRTLELIDALMAT